MRIDQGIPITPENISFVYDEKSRTIMAIGRPGSRPLGLLSGKLAQDQDVQMLFFEHLIGVCRGDRTDTQIVIQKANPDRPARLLPQEANA